MVTGRLIRRRTRRLVTLGVCAAALGFTPAANAANLVVSVGTDTTNVTPASCASAANNCTLRQAVLLSNVTPTTGDTITFSGVTTANVTGASGAGNTGLNVQGPVTIDGGGTVTIQRATNLTASIATFSTGGVVATRAGTLQNLTLQGSSTAGGSNVNVTGSAGGQNYTLTMDHVRSQGNPVNGFGGGPSVAGAGGVLKIIDSTIAGNTATAGNRGGGIEVGADGSLELTRSLVTNNTAPIGGGLEINNGATGTATITNSTLSGNNVTPGGLGASIYEFAS